MATTIGSLKVDLSLRTAKLSQGIKQADRKFQQLEKTSKRVGKVIGAAFGVVAAGGLSVLTKQAFDTIDSLGKTADKLGTTTEALAGMRLAANLAGVETKALDKGLQRMLVTVADAEAGLSTAVDALAAVGLQSKDLVGLRPEEVFKRISDGMKELGTRTEQLGVIKSIFGGKGAGLINLLDGGSDALDKVIERAIGLGTAINRIDAKQVENANDSFRVMREVVDGVGNSIAITLAPLLTIVSERFSESADGAMGFRNEMRLVIDVAARLAGVFADAGRVLDIFALSGVEAFISLKLGVLTFVRDAEQFLVDFGNSIISTVLKPIEAVLRPLSVFSDTAREALQSVRSFRLGASGAFDASIREASTALQIAREEVFKLLAAELPSDKILRELDETFTKAAQKAREEVKKIQADISGGTGERSIAGVLAAKRAGKGGKTSSAGGDVAKEIDAARRSAEALVAATRTPLENIMEQISELNELFAKGAFDGLGGFEKYQEVLARLRDDYNETMEAISEKTEETNDTLKTLADELARDIQNSLSDFLFDPFKEGTEGMVEQFANTLKRMAADLAAAAITDKLKEVFAAAASASSAGGSGGGGGGGGSSGASSAAAAIQIAAAFFADGGIMTSAGPMPLKKYASGGVANSPQLAVFGEGSGAEAFVPLPDGRSIPVTMQGAGQNVVINVTTPNAESFRQSRTKLAADVRRSIMGGR